MLDTLLKMWPILAFLLIQGFGLVKFISDTNSRLKYLEEECRLMRDNCCAKGTRCDAKFKELNDLTNNQSIQINTLETVLPIIKEDITDIKRKVEKHEKV